MGLLADLARKEFLKKASEGFDEIDLKIYNEIILPLEENIDLYAEKSDQIIEIQESVLVAYDAYEDIATIITNIRRARKVAQASEKTADTSDKASTIASALDKISAAISYGLKVLKDKLREEIRELLEIEQYKAPLKKEFGIRKERILDTLERQKKRFDTITENRRKQQEKLTAKREELAQRRRNRLAGRTDFSGPIGQAVDYVEDAVNTAVNEIRNDLFGEPEKLKLEESTKLSACGSD